MYFHVLNTTQRIFGKNVSVFLGWNVGSFEYTETWSLIYASAAGADSGLVPRYYVN